MGVAIPEINHPWLVNIGILYHSGYFHEAVDNWVVIALSMNWEMIYPVYFIKGFKLMTSVLSLSSVCLNKLVFLSFSLCFSTCFNFVAVTVYNFTISCLQLKLMSLFIKFLLFHQVIALKKLCSFISSKKLFLFSRYSNFCNFSIPFHTS